MLEKRQVEIPMGVVFRTALLILAVWFLYLIRDVLALLFIAVLIDAVIDPAVDWLQRRKIPRTLGVIFIYILAIIILVVTISFLIPLLAQQFRDFSNGLPQFSTKVEQSFGGINNYFQTWNINFNTQQVLSDIGRSFSGVSKSILSQTIGVFSGIVSTIIVLVIAFYMAVNENGIKRFIISIIPVKHAEYAADLTDRVKGKIGKWMQGQLVLMLIIFILDFIGLSIIGVPYALILAIFAGVMEIIPYAGPIISAIPGIILGLLVSPLTGLLAALVYFIIQQFEGHIIVPQVMKKAVGINPIAVILALLVGLKLGGILGAILAVPLATVVNEVVHDFMRKE